MSAVQNSGTEWWFERPGEADSFKAKIEARKKVVEDLFNRPGRAQTVLTGANAFKPADPSTALTGLAPDAFSGQKPIGG
jgi:hypothetical protein